VGTRERTILAIVGTDATYQRRGDDWVGKCIMCNRALTIAGDGRPLGPATIEHIWPRNHGGDDRLENLALACAGCNHEKGTRHDHKRKDDARLTAISTALAARRAERWRDADDVGLGAHVRWLAEREA
jgi:5-methylcytosine-specific restriction endonuclease McrA